MILVQQRKQAKIGFETFRSKYIKLCVSSDVGKKEIRFERKRTCFLRRSNMRFSIRALSINKLEFDNIKSLPKTKCADRGRKCQWPELEKKVVEWVEENRKSGLAVTRNLIRLHAKKNRTTNEYRQFPRLKWVVHSVHEAEQTRAAPENENITAVA